MKKQPTIDLVVTLEYSVIDRGNVYNDETGELVESVALVRECEYIDGEPSSIRFYVANVDNLRETSNSCWCEWRRLADALNEWKNRANIK